MFSEDGVTITGEPALYTLTSDSGATVTRAFCKSCGSQLFGRSAGMPGFMTITLGTLDAPNAFVPQVAIFARSRRAWDLPDPSVATFDAQPGWKPGDPV